MKTSLQIYVGLIYQHFHQPKHLQTSQQVHNQTGPAIHPARGVQRRSISEWNLCRLRQNHCTGHQHQYRERQLCSLDQPSRHPVRSRRPRGMCLARPTVPWVTVLLGEGGPKATPQRRPTVPARDGVLGLEGAPHGNLQGVALQDGLPGDDVAVEVPCLLREGDAALGGGQGSAVCTLPEPAMDTPTTTHHHIPATHRSRTPHCTTTHDHTLPCPLPMYNDR